MKYYAVLTYPKSLEEEQKEFGPIEYINETRHVFKSAKEFAAFDLKSLLEACEKEMKAKGFKHGAILSIQNVESAHPSQWHRVDVRSCHLIKTSQVA